MNQQEILTALVEQIGQQDMQLTVLRSAYLTMARQLDRRGMLPLADLQADVWTMGTCQPDEGWQSGHRELAALLHALRDTTR
ncbi:hypothetical protein [Burkholderia anthina]|uniref:hypothetical protein n=1 Tax=Burkholderia anthina TaxID=179879 RepID=UPI00158EB31E|nr:hypothetical protein [Burkholderia anthina]